MTNYNDGRRAGLFWAKVHKTPGCWEWRASISNKGYGQFWDGQRLVLTHRYSWTMAHGDPGEMWVLHRCDNPPCVRPDHLFLGDVNANVADMMQKGRHVTLRGEAAPNARLSDADVADIRRRHVRGRNRYDRGNSADLAAEYGISIHYVQDLVKGAWRRTQ